MEEVLHAKSLSLDDVMCPVCLDILIEPVTMACNHELCKECYDENFSTCNFSCPICKRRLSTWARKATSQGTLINQQKWMTIQKEYPDLIAQRTNGHGNMIFTKSHPTHFRIAKPGELQEEYIEMKQQWLNEQSSERLQQEEASLQLINKIMEEEKAELERKRKKQQDDDERLARKLSVELEMKISPSHVNHVILRSRKILSPISENNQSSSRDQPQNVIVTRSTRKRKRSEL